MKVGIIGAGASGMMAAVTAAEYHAEVTLFEKNDRVGKKILATGNGKCKVDGIDPGGNPIDELGQKCLASWKKYFPDSR